ncbi:LysR family transcriptional regulator [Streptomyces sp. AJS327]|uniref:LysR family transcriptional regulator n=1 Tax=Streptomyces sp. AJS327 TaxID=2545265 RepID=UPI0015DE4996|nr:LysR family transcriptional regulator [Streptomyces sp. AJS327]MBA0049538.1 LysR family transcriptional regulator [Streptomyces sp. AJS327]QTC09993.1 LysR family transcriptional regulator [Streptomyces sp.]
MPPDPADPASSPVPVSSPGHTGPFGPADIDPRQLRAFVAVAEELHFTRAAHRLHVAQQALSRDVRRLEHRVGAALFARTTRRTELTVEGARLLPYARRVLTAHDELRAACSREQRPLVVDASAPVSTGQRVLDAARDAAPDLEFVARYHSGLTGAATALLSGELDASFGRVAGLPPATLASLDHTLVRYERVAVLLPEEHPLARLPRIPAARLAGETLYVGAGNPDTVEWTEYARALFADGTGPAAGARPADPFPRIEGEAEFARLVRKRGWLVLASEVFTEVPGTVLRPVTTPRPLSPVSLVWRAGLRHPGLDVLRATARELGTADGWRHRPADSWLPTPDAQLHTTHQKS